VVLYVQRSVDDLKQLQPALFGHRIRRGHTPPPGR
jgi:hypothetical protein